MDKEINNLEDKFQDKLFNDLKPLVKMQKKHFELMKEEVEDIETAYKLHEIWMKAVWSATINGGDDE